MSDQKSITESERRTLGLVMALLETIKETGAQGAPSGVCYSAFMMHGISYVEYLKLVDIVLRTGKVRQSANCFYWIGE